MTSLRNRGEKVFACHDTKRKKKTLIYNRNVKAQTFFGIEALQMSNSRLYSRSQVFYCIGKQQSWEKHSNTNNTSFNMVFTSGIHTHSPPISKHSAATTTSITHLVKYLSCLPTHSSPPHAVSLHLSTAQPLSYQAQGFTEAWLRPKVLYRGHNLADKDCGTFGSVF